VTTHVKLEIAHNLPVVLLKAEDEFSIPEVIRQTEGTPGEYHGGKLTNMEFYIHGAQRLIIKESVKVREPQG
jgi:hypothetical protein